MKKKIKRKWGKGIGPRSIYGVREDKFLDDEADHILDGYATPQELDHQDLDDVNLDENDYELQQEKMYGVESEKGQPIPLDRYFKRIR